MNDVFNWPVRVYYEDTDVGGVVYYANYLKFYERACTEMLRAMGFEQDELLNVSARLSLVKTASLIFEQSITLDDELLRTATIRIACLDSDTLRPRHIPDVLKQAIVHE